MTKNETLWNFIAIKNMIEMFGEVFLDESDIPMIEVVIEALRGDTDEHTN